MGHSCDGQSGWRFTIAYHQLHERRVISLSQEQRTFLMRGMGIFAGVLVVLLVVGTFADYQIAQAVYAPDNPLVIFLSTLGLFPMVYSACFFLGVLAQRSLASRRPRAARGAGAALCVLLAMLFGALVTRALLSVRDGFGGIFGSELPALARMAIGCLVGAGLCAAGFRAGKANDATDLARRVLVVVVALVASYVVVEIVKNLMTRPRPWVVLAGYEGVEFSPWYRSTQGTQDLMATYGLERDAFKSFPSGHSVQAASVLLSFYGLALVYPSLQGRLGVALVVELVFAPAVMACRMVLGAHFLSDVSVGALVSVAAFLILQRLLEREPSRPEPRP